MVIPAVVPSMLPRVGTGGVTATVRVYVLVVAFSAVTTTDMLVPLATVILALLLAVATTVPLTRTVALRSDFVGRTKIEVVPVGSVTV